MKILVGIPVYITNELHLDFTLQTLNSVMTKHDYKIVVVDNRVDEPYLEELKQYTDIEYVKNDENTVAKAWNIAIQKAKEQGYDYVLLPNNDIVMRRTTIDNLIEFAEETKGEGAILWTANSHDNLRTLTSTSVKRGHDEHPHFSCFMVSIEGLEKLRQKEEGTSEPMPGLFDEGYKAAYFEDNDMHQRIIRAGFKAYKTASAIFYHYGSRTIKTDDELYLENQQTHKANREYFQKKWGFQADDPNGVPNDDPRRFAYEQPFKPKK